MAEEKLGPRPMGEIKTYNVAVVGATGAVGLEMVKMLENLNFPVKSLRLFASERSLGKKIDFKNKPISVEELKENSISNLDVALFSAGASISRKFVPIFAQKDIFVVDNSSAWRMDPDIPLVVPEVNPEKLTKNKKIIANPNCSTIQMIVALKPLHDAAKIKTVRVSTYQAVSGAGAKGFYELETQTKAWSEGAKIPPPSKFSHQIAFNVLPHIDQFLAEGYTKEEMKMVHETKKILGDQSIKVSATCVRVPVFRGHSEAIWIETEKPLSPDEARSLLEKAPGVSVIDNPSRNAYPMPIHASGKPETFVGRIRKDLSSNNGLVLWVVSDNLLKGAALNAVQIAELLVSRKII